MEKLTMTAVCTASVERNVVDAESMPVLGFYSVKCFGADGQLKWEDDYKNLVTNVGKADALDRFFKGSAYTAAFYFGLVDGGSAPTYNAADTMSSHAGWTENVAYSNATRVAAVFGTAAGTGGGSGTAGTGTVTTSAAVFTINGTATIAGCFLNTVSTKSGTTGTLFSAGSFSGGNRAVVNGDTLNVTFTATN